MQRSRKLKRQAPAVQNDIEDDFRDFKSTFIVFSGQLEEVKNKQTLSKYWKDGQNDINLSNDKPAPRAVVELLMKKSREITRDIASQKTTTIRRNVTFLVFKCPKSEDCSEGGELFFEKGRRYTNPYNHLKASVSGGCETTLIEVYARTLQSKRKCGTTFGIRSNFLMTLNEREKAMYANMRLIVLKSLPICYFTDKELRNFSKFDICISKSSFRETLFKLVELVECSIRKDMHKTRGAIMHDGWTHNSTHYLGVFAVYNRIVDVQIDGHMTQTTKVAMPLISVSRMATYGLDVDRDASATAEASNFSAEVYIRNMKDIFHIFVVSVHNWSMCQISVSCSVNKRVEDLLNTPHIEWASYKLHLEVRRMIDNDHFLKSLIKSVHNTMLDCKQKLKTRAIFRNLSDLSPMLNNETRWSSTCPTINRFTKIYDSLIEVADAEDCDLRMDRRPIFKNRAIKYEKQLQEINVVTLELQHRGITLSQSCFVLDALIEAVRAFRKPPQSPFYGCKLSNHYISRDADIVKAKNFETNVVKIQWKEFSIMTDAEKNACENPLASVCTTTENNATEEQTMVNPNMANFLAAKRRKTNSIAENYINCDFILGSAAEVERLWSIAKNILVDNRKKTTPLVFEALVFLKINKEYWNEQSVKTAMAKTKSDSVERYLRNDDERLDLASSL